MSEEIAYRHTHRSDEIGPALEKERSTGMQQWRSDMMLRGRVVRRLDWEVPALSKDKDRAKERAEQRLLANWEMTKTIERGDSLDAEAAWNIASRAHDRVTALETRIEALEKRAEWPTPDKRLSDLRGAVDVLGRRFDSLEVQLVKLGATASETRIEVAGLIGALRDSVGSLRQRLTPGVASDKP